MKRGILKTIGIIIAISCVTVLALSPSDTFADTMTLKQKGLTLSPLRTELNIEPGTSLDGVLTVTNSSEKPMTVDLSAEVFSVINQQYDYAFTEESNVVKWVSFSESKLTLAAEKSQKVTYTVGVPLSAEPGGRYISLFASTDTGLPKDGIESRQRVASLLYITVLGDVTREGHLLSLTSPWFLSGENSWNTALQNTGTTHFRSRYNVRIKDLIWNGVFADISGEALILPGTVRSVSDVLPAPQIPGIYKVVYTIGLGDTPAVTKSRFMLFVPPWATVLIISISIVFVYWFARKRFIKN